MDGHSQPPTARSLPRPAARRTRPASPVADGWRVSLVIPAYNEEAGIREAIAEADEALAGLASDYEILVVDDGSRDGTAAAVAEVSALRPHVRLLRHERNRGYGAALRTGFEAARFERVAFTDADGQFDLADLGGLLALTDRCPVAIGYRIARQDSWRRCFLSRGYNLLTRTLLGTRVRDCDCALKVFRREVLGDLLPQTSGFFVNAEMLTRARQLGHEVAETGVRHRPRLHGRSKVSLGDVPRTLAVLLPFWWSRVLFPGPGTAPAPSPTPATRRTTLLSLLLLTTVAGLLFFLRLRAPLLEPQEPRYAEIPRQMLAEDSWLVPVLHGQPYLDKPPLLYWLVMGSYRLLGVHDWAARLVPGLAGLLTVLVTYFWGRRTLGPRAGLLGALVLALSGEFVYRARMLGMDTLLCLWVVAGLAAGHMALLGRNLAWRWWLLAALACALGVLTKGPVALILIAVPLLLYQAFDPRCAFVNGWGWAAFVGLALGLAAPWYVAVAIARSEFAAEFLWRHHVLRFLAPFDHAKPLPYYLPQVLLGMLPWTLLLPGLVRFLLRHSARTAARRPAALGVFLLAALWPLFFFSVSGCKRPLYILPALPPLALALGSYLDITLVRKRWPGDWAALWVQTSRLAWFASLLVLAVGLVLGLLAASHRLVSLDRGIILASAAGAAFLALLLRRRLSWAVCGAITFIVLTAGVLWLQPGYNRQFALRAHLAGPNDLGAGERLTVVCYPHRWDSVSFYLPRAAVRTYAASQRHELLADLESRPRTLLLVKSGRVSEALLRDLPPSLEFIPRGRPGAITAGWVRSRLEPVANHSGEK